MTTAREPIQFGQDWAWARGWEGDTSLTLPQLLPGPIFDALAGCIDGILVKYYPTKEAALAALADAERRAGNHTGEG